MNIIEELWYGNISPCERDFKKGSKYTMLDKIIIGERESKHAKKTLNQKIRILFKGFIEFDELMCV